MQLKNQLQTIKRGNLSISDYLDKMNGIANNLALAGKLVDDDDFITLIMNGVGPTYDSIVNSTQARGAPILLDDLVGLLLSVEMRYEQQNTIAVENSVTALYAPKSKPNRIIDEGPSHLNNKSGQFQSNNNCANEKGSSRPFLMVLHQEAHIMDLGIHAKFVTD